MTEREREREAAKVGQREMDLLAEGPRSGGGWGGLGQSAAVIISEGQKGIRRGREAERPDIQASF